MVALLTLALFLGPSAADDAHPVLDGIYTYSNVRYMQRVEGLVGTELRVEVNGDRASARLSDYDGASLVRRTLKGTFKAGYIELRDSAARVEVVIVEKMEATRFNGRITRFLPGRTVQHPFVLQQELSLAPCCRG